MINKKLKEVLTRNIGDARECPYCRKSFIPFDKISKDTYSLFSEMFPEKEIDNSITIC